jgi:hypothetical protein
LVAHRNAVDAVQSRDVKALTINGARHTAQWIASVERGDPDYTDARLYANAPEAIRNCDINHCDKGTVFLAPASPSRLPPDRTTPSHGYGHA